MGGEPQVRGVSRNRHGALLLVPGILICTVVIAIIWQMTREAPPSLAQQCLRSSVGSLSEAPTTLTSRLDVKNGRLAVKAEFGRGVEPRYGLCALAGADLDAAGTQVTIANLTQTSAANCLQEKVFSAPLPSVNVTTHTIGGESPLTLKSRAGAGRALAKTLIVNPPG